ncbi:MAG: TRAP transporter small permease [Pseudomonadota bacterium]
MASAPPPKRDEMSEALGRATRNVELADPDAAFGPVDRWINRVAEAVGVVVLVFITGLVFLNACLRYLAATSFIWIDEVAVGLIPWLAFIGLFLSVRRRQYIRIGFFVDRMPAGVRRPLNLVIHVISALVFAYLAWGAFAYVTTFGGDATTYLKLPKGIFQSAVLVGAIAVAVAFLLPVRQGKGARQ